MDPLLYAQTSRNVNLSNIAKNNDTISTLTKQLAVLEKNKIHLDETLSACDKIIEILSQRSPVENSVSPVGDIV